ncbi:MAG: tetratricopeptide repeat protein [Bdellovibrionota bacterium]
MKSFKLRLLGALILIFVGTSSCLKTRYQLREDERETTSASSKNISNKVQEVKADNQYIVDELKSEFTRLSGRVEEVERTQKAAPQAGTVIHKEEYKKLENRVLELETAQREMIERIQSFQKAQEVSTANPSDLFEKAKTHFDAKEYEAAIHGFTDYLKNPRAKSSEAAIFFRAESYFAIKDYKNAIIDYSKFPEKFTKSKRMPAALLKIGQSFEGLGMKNDAKPFYQELTEKFPKSPEAKKAKAKHK